MIRDLYNDYDDYNFIEFHKEKKTQLVSILLSI